MKRKNLKKLKTPTAVEDLAALAKMQQTPEWQVFMRMSRNRIEYQKDHIIGLPEKNPYLAIDKAYDRGLIAGILIGLKTVETAATEMEKLAEKDAD